MRARGERHGRAKLTLLDCIAIRAVLAGPSPATVYAVAKAFGVSRRQVRRIRDGEAWV